MLTTPSNGSSETTRADGSDVRLVLASASPRRRELLTFLNVPFTVVATNAEDSDTAVPAVVVESLPPCPLPTHQHPSLLAWRKAHAVWSSHTADVVLGADTTVMLDGKVCPKPRDATHAYEMLTQLSGQTHTVYTGLCVFSRLPNASQEHHQQTGLLHLVATEVTMEHLQSDAIEAYIATEEPLDKAGAYAVQGIGAQLVRQVVGSFTSVVGLPLQETWKLLTAAGISALHEPSAAYIAWLTSQGKEPLPCPPTLP
jgi:septum formation protein